MAALKSDNDLEIIEKLDREEKDVEDGDSDSDDSSDDEDEERPLKRVRDNFDRILADLKSSAKSGRVKSGTFDLTTPTGLLAFLDHNKADLGKRNTKNQTLLHLIAEAEKDELPPTRKMKLLIEELVHLSDNLLAMQDENGKTPLFCAVTNRNHKLVTIMCEAHHDVNSILKIPKTPTARQSTNCIHQAIMKKSSSRDDDLLKFLIEKADEDTLLAVDENGFTPLHLAVEYKRCDDAQRGIVQALVERCDKVLSTTYRHPERGSLSPYLYHEFTHEEAKQRERQAIERKQRPETEGVQRNERFRSKDNLKDKKRELSNEKLREPVMPEEPGPPSFPSSRWTHIDRFDPMLHIFDRSRSVVTGAVEINGISRRETSTTIEKKPSSKRSRTSKLNPTESSALAIKQYLKLEYLRKNNHDDAVEYLYGVQQDRHIYFDLSGVSPKVNKGGIIGGLNHLLLEDVLQYVEIPRVEVEDDPVTLKPGQRALKPDGNGRKDMEPLFKWLRDEKKVNTILKVIVEDLQEPAHSDETIEACLTGMGVEIWQWKKFDLSPEIIQKVAPGARVVHLYWSGNNAVLRGWSEPGGLRMLRELEEVHLHAQQGLETRARITQNITAFKERIENGVIKVYETRLMGDITGSMANGTNATHDPHERDKWVDSMEQFADFLQAAERNIEPPLTLKHPVTVAIIDDGVDINNQSIQSRIIGGWSFCHRDKDQNLNQSYYVSGDGHGTAMAGLICKVCPNVSLYILRLDEYVIETGKRHITAKSAAKAVLAAVERKVDIISMSWTIEKTDRNGDDIKKLEDAISLAARKNILMFCAATDQGTYKDRTYPAASATKKIFKIGAADASGAALKWVGDQSLVDFMFPGDKVVIERHDNPNVKNYTPRTGSSVATALASALAAVILYCVQLANTKRYAGRSNELSAYKSLKDHERMKEAFSQIGTSKATGNKYIMVWNRFTREVKKAEQESAPKDEYMNYIMTLADELMREA
ncbi:hypothetical protein F4781DRAFT_425759 [Annulohypoxylon bovei var. microspora]|nr:hypothetical protein F4781DRAFT_425759 [Annulohypoxylon bovei var. microspora]